MTVVVRAAEARDCDVIADMTRALARDIGAATVPKVTGATLAARAFADPPRLWLLVAEHDGTAVGCVVASPTFSTWRGTDGLYIVDLYVAPAHRGHGIARALLAETARLAARLGAGYLKLEVHRDNATALRLYDRLGFEALDDEMTFVLEADGISTLVDRG